MNLSLAHRIPTTSTSINAPTHPLNRPKNLKNQRHTKSNKLQYAKFGACCKTQFLLQIGWTNPGHAALRGWSLIFYGSKQPIDRNDPVSVPLIPLNILHNTSTVSSQATNVTKGNGAKGNRKQQQHQQQQSQQQQQKSSQLNASQSSGRKNSKTNGKNANGKNWKQRLTSPRPQTTLLNKDSNKLDRINGIANTNKTAKTTVRPKKLSNNNVDNNKGADKTVYAKSPIKAPKQVKEIISMAASNGNIHDDTNIHERNDFGNTSTSMLAQNTIQSTTTTAAPTASSFDTHVELVANFQYTSNPNIPKLFQRYEKIQEFYPEFHPYVGLPKASSSISGSAIAGKPSRDGSKYAHFSSASNPEPPPSSHSHELASDRNGNQDASGVQKPISSRTQSSAIISSTNGKG